MKGLRKGKAMTGIETQILKTIQELERADPASIARHIGISEGWVLEICQIMAADRYLNALGDGTFELTERSTRKLSPVKSRGRIPVLKGGI